MFSYHRSMTQRLNQQQTSALGAQRGATLLHMLCVITTLGALSAVLFPRFVNPEGGAKTNVADAASADLAPPLDTFALSMPERCARFKHFCSAHASKRPETRIAATSPRF